MGFLIALAVVVTIAAVVVVVRLAFRVVHNSKVERQQELVATLTEVNERSHGWHEADLERARAELERLCSPESERYCHVCKSRVPWHKERGCTMCWWLDDR